MPCSQPVPSLCSQSPFYTARSEHLKYHITIVYSYVCLPEKVWAPPSKDKVVPICMGPALGTAAGIQMFANSSASSQNILFPHATVGCRAFLGACTRLPANYSQMPREAPAQVCSQRALWLNRTGYFWKNHLPCHSTVTKASVPTALK
jgi:hypothetical protein